MQVESVFVVDVIVFGIQVEFENSVIEELVKLDSQDKIQNEIFIDQFVVQKFKFDIEIQVSLGVLWEVFNDIDKKLEQMTENQQTRLVKFEEFEEFRIRGRVRERLEDLNMFVRERFNVNFNFNIRF